MFDLSLAKTIEAADARAQIVVIASVKAKPEKTELDKLKAHGEKRRYVNAFYEAAKQPLRSLVGKTRGLVMVNALYGTAESVLSAPATAWRVLLKIPILLERQFLSLKISPKYNYRESRRSPSFLPIRAGEVKRDSFL